MNIFSTAGSYLHIGAALSLNNYADAVAADFADQAWTVINGTTNLGSAGDTAALITTTEIGPARDRKLKGSRNAGSMAVVANLNYADPGQLAIIAAEKSKNPFAFRLVFNDAPPARSSEVTITVAAPGVVSWADHGLANGDQVKLSTTGALPTGLVAGTTYYVVAAAEDTFSLAATKGGSAITTSSTQSGTHTATTVPTPSERLFTALVMSTAEQWNEANSVMAVNITLEIDSNIVRVAPTGA